MAEQLTFRIELDSSRCSGIGICESLAPTFFEVQDDGSLVMLKQAASGDDIASVMAAVDGCPAEALKLQRQA
jgi:ferredoxin